jgi:hypothetical protein
MRNAPQIVAAISALTRKIAGYVDGAWQLLFEHEGQETGVPGVGNAVTKEKDVINI